MICLLYYCQFLCALRVCVCDTCCLYITRKKKNSGEKSYNNDFVCVNVPHWLSVNKLIRQRQSNAMGFFFFACCLKKTKTKTVVVIILLRSTALDIRRIYIFKKKKVRLYRISINVTSFIDKCEA